MNDTKAGLGVPCLSWICCPLNAAASAECRCFKKDGSSPASPRMTTVIMAADDLIVSTLCSSIC
jgi:hypothetical protein